MNFKEAKQEFEIRYYLWAISESEKEINENFPNLRLFKNGACWELHQFMQQLDRGEQLMLSHGLLKSFHPKILPVLEQSISVDENILLDRFVKFRKQFNGAREPKLGATGEKSNLPARARSKRSWRPNFSMHLGAGASKFPLVNIGIFGMR